MDDRPKSGEGQAGSAPAEYPLPGFSVAFADGVSNAVWGRGHVKWYFYRSEPAMLDPNAPTKDAPFAQVVMPVEGFIHMSLFFEQLLNRLVKDGYVTQERLDEMRATRAASDQNK